MNAPATTGSSHVPSLRLSWLVLLIASCYFLARGPLRSIGHGDLATPYIETQLFLSGQNPYPEEGFLSRWKQDGDVIQVNRSGTRPIYPPTTLPLTAPLGLLSWNHAVQAFVMVGMTGYLALVFALAGTVGADWQDPLRFYFLAFAMALSPIHTGIALGNLSVIGFLLVAFAVWEASRFRDVESGILLGIATCMKPTTALAAWALFLMLRRWKVMASWLAATGVIAAAAMVQMARIGGPWREDYQSNLAYLFGPNGAASFTNANPGHFDLVNLQVPLYEFLHSAVAANVIAWSVVAVLIVAWIYAFRRRGSEWHWGLVAAALLIGLLPVYQRTYNAGIVLFAIYWAFRYRTGRAGKIVPWISLLFVVPVEAMLRRSLPVSKSFQESVAWRVFLLPAWTWALLALAVILIVDAARSRRGADPVR